MRPGSGVKVHGQLDPLAPRTDADAGRSPVRAGHDDRYRQQMDQQHGQLLNGSMAASLRAPQLERNVDVATVGLQPHALPFLPSHTSSWSRTKPICSHRLRTARAVHCAAISITGVTTYDDASLHE